MAQETTSETTFRGTVVQYGTEQIVLDNGSETQKVEIDVQSAKLGEIIEVTGEVDDGVLVADKIDYDPEVNTQDTDDSDGGHIATVEIEEGATSDDIAFLVEECIERGDLLEAQSNGDGTYDIIETEGE